MNSQLRIERIIYDFSRESMDYYQTSTIKYYSKEYTKQLLSYAFITNGVGCYPLYDIDGMDNLLKQADIIEDIILKVDWSAWFDIYIHEDYRIYEYAGIICCDLASHYYAPLLYAGDKYSIKGTRDYFTKYDIDIHSHPLEFIDRKCTTMDELPSAEDYNASIGICSVLVTKAGITIYGRPKYEVVELWDIDCNVKEKCDKVLRRYEWSCLRLPNAKNTRYFTFTNSKYIINKPIIEYRDMIYASEYNYEDDIVPFSLFDSI